MSETFLYEIVKNKNGDYNVWMAFPGIYSFSMSSLGYLWICRNIDLLEDVNLERICTDTKTTKLMSKDINLIGFSFSFDLDFLNIFKILDRYKIPLKSSERDNSHPMVFGGGPVLSSNPEPFSAFFDFIIIGDGEGVNIEAINICKGNKDKPKEEILKKLSEIEGVYVPSLDQNKVIKASCGLSECIFTPVLSEKSFFKNTFIIEIARGCSNRCGFCLASYLNLPQRFVEYEKIIECIDLGLEHTNKIAILGALISAHPEFENICKYIYDKVQNGKEIELSVSSLRADAIEPEVVKTLVICGQRNTTIAIEAGSDRLRKVINKNLKGEQILKTVQIAKENGLKGLKIYAMIGLPTETQEDLKEMIELVRKIRKIHKGFNLSFSFSTFVPKPHTPFQWCGREDTKSLERKQNYLKKEFHKLGVKANFSSAKWDYYQTLLSRGGKELCDYVLEVYKLGGTIGAFKSAYKEVAQKNNLQNSDYYTLRKFSFDEVLPWDFIEVPPGKEFLKKENERLLKRRETLKVIK
jgi:radical SAM superfamily enzyme YgiQ (UPF0313 family)